MRIQMQGSDDQKSENYLAGKEILIFLLKNRKLYPYACMKDIQAT